MVIREMEDGGSCGEISVYADAKHAAQMSMWSAADAKSYQAEELVSEWRRRVILTVNEVSRKTMKKLQRDHSGWMFSRTHHKMFVPPMTVWPLVRSTTYQTRQIPYEVRHRLHNFPNHCHFAISLMVVRVVFGNFNNIMSMACFPFVFCTLFLRGPRRQTQQMVQTEKWPSSRQRHCPSVVQHQYK